MAHLVQLKNIKQGYLYGFVGPFDSFGTAGSWLESNGFRSMEPNYWERIGKAELNYPGNRITVDSAGAYIFQLQTLEEIDFVPL